MCRENIVSTLKKRSVGRRSDFTVQNAIESVQVSGLWCFVKSIVTSGAYASCGCTITLKYPHVSWQCSIPSSPWHNFLFALKSCNFNLSVSLNFFLYDYTYKYLRLFVEALNLILSNQNRMQQRSITLSQYEVLEKVFTTDLQKNNASSRACHLLSDEPWVPHPNNLISPSGLH